MWLLWLACTSEQPQDSWVTPGCGDGVIDPAEACDDGAANSDTQADACRLDCTLPTCGDAVVDSGETCDDANAWGADGCSPVCETETLPAETEPNGLEDAQAWNGPITGALSDGEDRDCYTVAVPDSGYLSAWTEGPGGACPEPLLLELRDPSGDLLAVGSPSEGSDADSALGCTPIDPSFEPAARFMEPGDWTVCAAPFLEQPAHSYDLHVQVGDDSCALDLAWPADQDMDGDGLSAECDSDDDGDGLDDVDDNCPDVPNAGGESPLRPDAGGMITDWLMLGPLSGNQSPDQCLPTGDLLSPNDADAAPSLGQVELGETWVVRSGTERLDFTTELGTLPDPDREVYTAVWVHSDSAQDLTLSIGADDGVLAWLNGDLVLEVSSCQGTNKDQFQSDVALSAGWNRLMVKVLDHGGGWGLYARFLDSGGAPVTDLELSLQADATWAPDQTDTDGDGLGDVCDPTPGG